MCLYALTGEVDIPISGAVQLHLLWREKYVKMRVTHQNSYHKTYTNIGSYYPNSFHAQRFHNSGLDWWFRNWSQPFPYASDCCLATLEPWSTKIGVVTTMSPWIQVLGWTPRWLPWSCCSPLPSNPCSLTCLSRPKLDCSGLVHCFFSMWHITLMCRVVGTAVAEVKQRAGIRQPGGIWRSTTQSLPMGTLPAFFLGRRAAHLDLFSSVSNTEIPWWYLQYQLWPTSAQGEHLGWIWQIAFHDTGRHLFTKGGPTIDP